MRLPDDMRQRLRCPLCAARAAFDEECRCTNPGCGQRFPVIGGVPVLINERMSVFRFEDFVEGRKTFFDPAADPRGWRARLARLLYENAIDLKSESILRRLAVLLRAAAPTPRVLVIGAGVEETGVAALRTLAGAELVLTDVFLGWDVSLVCDAHEIPFDDGTFDGVVAQAVLEHVVDPYRCVAEIHRVLKPAGIVYSEIPFMQQVHGGEYDFTRFTHLGQRRLFRHFEEIESGASSGPALALIWSWRAFLMSFSASRTSARLLRVLAKLTSFWWKYFDRILIDRPAALDAACSMYFIGRRSEVTLSDRALLQSYRGSAGRF